MVRFDNKLGLIASIVATATTVQAPAGAPPQLAALLGCRNIGDAEARLRCFDEQAQAVAAAISSKELAVVSRDQVRKGKRTLFGLSIPRLPLFGDDESQEDAIKQIEGRIVTVSGRANGSYQVALEDGSTWLQVDSRSWARPPKSGDAVTIRRAALGSYLMRVDGQIGVRVRRVR